MKCIIIGAGRGMRLMPNTSEIPKCMVEINGTKIIDIILKSLNDNGIDNIVFIGGYKIDLIKSKYHNFTYYLNNNWMTNNILESLMYANEELNDDLIITYSDIIYNSDAIKKISETCCEVALMIDQNWQTKYLGRDLHPESEAEKVSIANDQIVKIGKNLQPSETHGEFIGLLKMSKYAAMFMKNRYEIVKDQYADIPFHNAANIKKAYLTDMLQEIINQGIKINYTTITNYWDEIDTVQDLHRVQSNMPDEFGK